MKLVSENSKANKTLFLAGDSNINVLDYKNNQNFVNLMFGFTHARATSYTATTIDNIITNSIFDNILNML